MSQITITGGTGTVGRLLTRTLLAQGLRVRVLTRDADKARKAFDHADVEVVAVDFDAPATLAAALRGSERAFLAMGTSARQVRDEKALIDAAVAADVPWLVNLSVGGAGSGVANNVLEWHGEIDAHLRASGVPHATLRPATYVDAIFRIAASFIPHGTWGGTAGEGRAAFIDVRDVAAVAAVVLSEGARRHAGRVYDLTGAQAVSMPGLAKLVSAAVGARVGYTARSADEQRAAYAAANFPPLAIDVMLGLDDLTRAGPFETPTSAVEDLSGAVARSPQRWIVDNLATLRRLV